jgi:hypothetical protein
MIGHSSTTVEWITNASQNTWYEYVTSHLTCITQINPQGEASQTMSRAPRLYRAHGSPAGSRKITHSGKPLILPVAGRITAHDMRGSGWG